MREGKSRALAEAPKKKAAKQAAKQAAAAPLAPKPEEGRLSLKLFLSGAGASAGGARSPGGGAAPDDGGAASLGGPFGIVVDDGGPVAPGQIARAEFIAAMSAEIERVAGAELAAAGRTTRDCPYLAHWLGFYRGRAAGQIERAIERYARPERTDLAGLRDALLARVRTAVQAWVRSGGREVQAPDGVAWTARTDGVPDAPAGAGALHRKDGAGTGPPESADPDAVRAELGRGEPLEPGVRERMERGFGSGFGDVRLHTGGGAARLAYSLSARAFALGTDVAFGPGQYRPNSPEGEALLAHELAHVVQQRGTARSGGPVPVEARGSPLERQADAAAGHVVRSLWSSGHAAAHPGVALPLPAPRGALRLQRCSSDAPAPAPAPPAPSPREQMKTVVDEVLQDNSVAPAEWQRLNERARALGMAEGDVDDLAREHAGVGWNVARYVAVLATRRGAVFDTVRAAYTGTFAADVDVLTPPLIPEILRAALADGQLDFAELDAMRTLALRGQTSDYGDLRQALTGANLDAATVAGLMRVVDVGGLAWNSLESDPVALPIRVAPNAAGHLAAAGDLRVVLLRALTGDGAWSSLEFPAIRSLLLPLGHVAARALLEASGITTGADMLAKQFTAPAAEYAQRMPQDIRFRRDGRNFALDTPLFPEVPASALPRGAPFRPVGDVEDLGTYAFRGGGTLPAERQSAEIRGRRIPVIRPRGPDYLLVQINGYIRASDGLAAVPAHHLPLIRLLVIDPGELQDAAADAGRDGVVTMYYGSSSGGTDAVRVMVHEVGHLVSFQAAAADATFWTRWNQAAREDAAAVSVYGTNNQLEDFAEAYLMLVVNPAAARTRFPHRVAILAPLVAPPPPPPVPAPSAPTRP